MRSLPANIDLHHLIERDAVLAAIVELGRAGGGMRCHLARLLERSRHRVATSVQSRFRLAYPE